VGDATAAFSPLSGETHLLNDTCAAVLFALMDGGPLAAPELTAHLAKQCGLTADDLAPHVVSALEMLANAGLTTHGSAP
jgi:PqqD family protein of HPr-rel-A system